MKIENQVCTLEQAKRLKELGVEQSGEYGYIEIPSNGCPVETFWQNKTHALIRTGIVMFGGNGDRKWVAFTNDELEQLLTGQTLPIYWNLWGEWAYQFRGNTRGYETEAIARAALLIELLEFELILPSEINNRLIKQ